jgi:hypothetical protein
MLVIFDVVYVIILHPNLFHVQVGQILVVINYMLSMILFFLEK